MEWADRIGIAFWVVVLIAVAVVFVLVALRLLRMAAAARRGDFSPGAGNHPGRRAPGASARRRSSTTRGSSLRPESGDAPYDLGDPEHPDDASGPSGDPRS